MNIIRFCFLLLLISNCYARDLTLPLTNSLFIAPVNYNGYSSLTSRVGNCVIPAPAYHIAQWNNPQPLTGSCINNNANASTRVAYINNNTWELAQNSALLACNAEFNLFIEANRFPPLGLQRSSKLSILSNLTLTITSQIIYEKIGIKCKNNNSAAIIGLVLDNPIKNQTLFYQIILKDSRPSLYPNLSWCPSYEQSTNNQFCIDDDIRIYGKPRLSNSSVTYNINILPRLIKILRLNHIKPNRINKLDPNLNNWSIGNAYFGNKATGEVLITTRWSNFSLTETPK